jgi:hypothetical protein
MKEITAEKLDKYLNLTAQALAKVKLKKGLSSREQKIGEKYLEMARNYLSDANHFKESGDWVNAFAAVNYAHAWLDAGAIVKIFDVDGDDVLFTVDAD